MPTNQPLKRLSLPTTLHWKGHKIARKVWVCDVNNRLLFSITAEQAMLLLAQKYVMETVDSGKLWRVTITRTPGETTGDCHSASLRDFCTPASVILKRYTRTIATEGTYEFTNREIDKRDRWAYLQSITDNIKRVSITKS